MSDDDDEQRWKAMCSAGAQIPAYAIQEYRLWRWYAFTAAGTATGDTYYATPRETVRGNGRTA